MVLAVLPQQSSSLLFLLSSLRTSQPSYTAGKVIWPVCKASITRNLGCTLLLHGLLSELVYDFCNDK